MAIFDPSGCTVPPVAPIEALPAINCKLPDPSLAPMFDCMDPVQTLPGRRELGAQGATGLQGFTGSAGGTGPRGPNGFDGLNGSIGADGPQGATGPKGRTGVQGPRGGLGYTAKGPDGPTGYVGGTGAQGDPGLQGPPGDKGPQGPPVKEAIVPCPYLARNAYVRLACVEMPDVRFEDIITVRLTSAITVLPLDRRYRAICAARTLSINSTVLSLPIPVGAKIDDQKITLYLAHTPPPAGVLATLRVSARRLGFDDRFKERTRAEAIQNDKFWSTPLRQS